MMRLLCLALAITLVNCHTIAFKDCGNHEVIDVFVDGCNSTSTCTFYPGEKVLYGFTFRANEDSKTALLEMKGKDDSGHNLERSLDVIGKPADACKRMRANACPMKKGDVYTWTYTGQIPNPAFTLEGDLTAKLYGDGKKLLACTVIHVALAGNA